MSKEFTFTYDATTGVLVAAALHEKARAHTTTAEEYRILAANETQLAGFYAEQAQIQDNNASLLHDAADRIHQPVRKALAEDMGTMLRSTGIIE